jgi:hypothetical protein
MLAVLALSAVASSAHAQAPAAATDIYHVMFVKAAPGQAAALAKDLLQVDPKDPMGSHFLLLRHQEGADWDYCVIAHVGTRASVELNPTAPTPGPATRAWHDDTYVSGPSWGAFQKLMGITASTGNPVFIVSTHRAVPGHRDQLLASLSAPNTGSKVTSGNVVLTHLQGGSWQFLSLTKYDSWQDLATDRSSAAGGGAGWLENRQHSASHSDTIADRVR